jgi:MraZ protein
MGADQKAVAAMLTGSYAVTVTAEGRVTVPGQVRAGLAAGVYLCPGLERGSLLLLPMETWARIRERVGASDLLDESVQPLLRLLGMGCEARLDSQGRLAIPAQLRERAGIERAAVMIGAFNRLELWNAQAWKEYEERRLGTTELTEAARSIFPGL